MSAEIISAYTEIIGKATHRNIMTERSPDGNFVIVKGNAIKQNKPTAANITAASAVSPRLRSINKFSGFILINRAAVYYGLGVAVAAEDDQKI